MTDFDTDHAPPVDPVLRARNRRMLVVIAIAFLGTFFAAGVLRFSGWRPAGLKSKGELLQPAADLHARGLVLADGQPYPWEPIARKWRIVVVPPAQCAQACDTLARQLDTVWQIQGKDASRVDVLWLGAVPAAAPATSHQRALRNDEGVHAALPRSGTEAGPVTYVMDPNGFAVLRYAPGFDPGDLRTDLSRLLKLQ